MNGEIFIPIVLFLSIAAVIILYVYYRSRERQMLIERDFTAQELREIFLIKRTTNKRYLSIIGIISICFGVGLSIGMMLEDAYHADWAIPFGIFVGTGLGFVIADRVPNRDHEEQ